MRASALSSTGATGTPVGDNSEVMVNKLLVRLSGQTGQTTAEYALVLLVAGLIVGVFAAFVRSGSLTDMFHEIVSGLIDKAGG